VRLAILAAAHVLAFSLIAVSSLAAEAETWYQSGNYRLLGDWPSHVQLAAGFFDFGNKYETVGGVVEFRGGSKYRYIGPALGVMANTEGGVFVYAGPYIDMIWRRLAITPRWAVGAYSKGISRDLGGTLQFRTAVTLAWVFDNDFRLGIDLAHISNGRVHHKNPGENEVMLSFSFPL
jgi:hypothetical protein